jgi:hypothetical protein
VPGFVNEMRETELSTFAHMKASYQAADQERKTTILSLG